MFRLREARKADLEFLGLMIYEAAYWRPGVARAPLEITLADRDIACWLEDWPRQGDCGVIAEGEAGSAIGAAWYRLWSDENHSWGYVDPETPELAIGVVAEHRGKGVGGALLAELKRKAAANGFRRLSLSVEKENPALQLYLKQRFRVVWSVENAWTMIAELDGL